MDNRTLRAALEREHREIDAGIEAFSAGQAQGARTIESLTRAMRALRRHIYLEEQFLFPAMREGFAIPIGVMQHEHGQIWRTLDVLEDQLHDSGDSASVLDRSHELLSQLERHNAKEEPIFYSQADRSLTPSASAQLQAFLDTGQMPYGWVCQAADMIGT
ncbi:MAG: hemerythrin domain-containing protein [Solirubrobacteraceae bacterium]